MNDNIINLSYTLGDISGVANGLDVILSGYIQSGYIAADQNLSGVIINYVSGNYLRIDQTVPQNIISGAPIFDSIKFSQTPIVPITSGILQWNDTDGTLDLGLKNGVTQQLGQELYILCVNKTGSTIPNGSVVCPNGRQGNRPKIILARSDSESTSFILGVTTHDILDNEEGYVTTFGYVRQIKTDYVGWSQDDNLYVSKTVSGSLTNIEPSTPHHSDIVGQVAVVGGVGIGSIFVNITRHKTLEELCDINGTSLTTSGQFPVWNQASGYFDFDKNINWYADRGTGFPVTPDVYYDNINRTISLSGIVNPIYHGIDVPEFSGGWVSPQHTSSPSGSLYLSSDGTTTSWSESVFDFNNILIGFVLYNQDNEFLWSVIETHNTMDPLAHRNNHFGMGTIKLLGGDFSSFNLGSTTPIDRRPDISSRSLLDEDLSVINSALTSKQYTIAYLSGSLPTIKLTRDYAEPIFVTGSQPFYNLNTGGNWSQTGMSVGSYAAIFVMDVPATKDELSQKSRTVFWQPQTQGTLLEIEAIDTTSLELNGLKTSLSEFNFIGKIIIRYIGGDWTLVSVEKLTGTKNSQVSIGGSYLSIVSTDTTLTGYGIPSSLLSAQPAIITASGNSIYLDNLLSGTLVGYTNSQINAYSGFVNSTYSTLTQLNNVSGLFLKKDGSTPLTGNWNAGSYNITTSGIIQASGLWSVYNNPSLTQATVSSYNQLWNTNFTSGAVNTLFFAGPSGYGNAAIYTKQFNQGNIGNPLFIETKSNIGSWNSNQLVLNINGYIGIKNSGLASELDVSGIITASGGNSTLWNTGAGWINGSGVLNTKIDNVSGTLNNKIWNSGSIVTAINNASGAAVTNANTNTTNVSGALKAQIWTSGSIVTAIANASGAAVITASGIANGLYVKKSGDTMSGDFIYRNTSGYYGITNVTTAPIHSQDTQITGSGWFAPFIHDTTIITGYGYRKHCAIGTYRNGIAWGGGIFFAQGGNDNYPTEYFLMNQGGDITWSGGGTTNTFYSNANISPLSGAIVTTASGIANNTYLKKDGSTPLTGNWDTGTNYRINAGQLTAFGFQACDYNAAGAGTWTPIMAWTHTDASETEFELKMDFNTRTGMNGRLECHILTSFITDTYYSKFQIYDFDQNYTTEASGSFALTVVSGFPGSSTQKFYTIFMKNPGNFSDGYYNPTFLNYRNVSGVTYYNNTTVGSGTLATALSGVCNRTASGIFYPHYANCKFKNTVNTGNLGVSGNITVSGYIELPNNGYISVGPYQGELMFSGNFGGENKGIVICDTASISRSNADIGNISVRSKSSTGAYHDYTRIVSHLSDYTEGSESSYIGLATMKAGLLANRLSILNDRTVSYEDFYIDSTKKLFMNGADWSTSVNTKLTTLQTATVFYQFPKDVTSYATSLASGAYGRVIFSIPYDYISLISLKLICVPIVTASGNRRVRLDIGYGKPGQDYLTHTSANYQTLNYGLHNIIQSIEVSGYLPANLEALDTGHFGIYHITDGAIPPPTGATYYYGLELKYNKY